MRTAMRRGAKLINRSKGGMQGDECRLNNENTEPSIGGVRCVAVCFDHFDYMLAHRCAKTMLWLGRARRGAAA